MGELEKNKLQFEAWLNGFISVLAYTNIKMNYYWSSTNKSYTIEFFYLPIKSNIKIPDENLSYENSKKEVLQLFEDFQKQIPNEED